MERIFELAGEPLEANPAIPLHRYVDSARRLLSEADRRGAAGEFRQRAVLLVRFNQLVLKTLPQHPKWGWAQNRALRESLRAQARAVLADLERLKSELEGRQQEQRERPDGDITKEWAEAANERGDIAAQRRPGGNEEEEGDAGKAASLQQQRDSMEARLRALTRRSQFMTDAFCQAWELPPAERRKHMARQMLREADCPVDEYSQLLAQNILDEYRLVRASPNIRDGLDSQQGAAGGGGGESSVDQSMTDAFSQIMHHHHHDDDDEDGGGGGDGGDGGGDGGDVEAYDENHSDHAVVAGGGGNQAAAAATAATAAAAGSGADVNGDRGGVLRGFSAAWAARWRVGFEALVIGPKIGSGGYGEVFVGKLHDRLIAVKHLLPVDGVYSRELLKSFREEMMPMSGLSHANIVQFVGACTRPPYLCILSEYVHGGTLYRLLQRRRKRRDRKSSSSSRRSSDGNGNGGNDGGSDKTSSASSACETLPWSGVLRIALGVARGMHYLHAQRPVIVHRDLKSPNCLVYSACSPAPQESGVVSGYSGYGGPIRCEEHFAEADVKLIDFGLSRTQLKSYISTGIAGTPEWMAPEVIRQDRVSESADVFSFGVILWELLTSEKPWGTLAQTQVVYRVGYLNETLETPAHAHPALREMIAACFQAVPRKRPRFGEIVQQLEQLCAATGVEVADGGTLAARRASMLARDGE